MSAVQELATYVGNPDRPYDARLLELVDAVQRERTAITPLRVYTALTAAQAAGADVDAVFTRLVEGAEL